MINLPSQCAVCGATLPVGGSFCESCGARVDEARVEELRGISYLLSELSRWEAARVINTEQAAQLRARYQHRREVLQNTHPFRDGEANFQTPLASQTSSLDSQKSQADSETPLPANSEVPATPYISTHEPSSRSEQQPHEPPPPSQYRDAVAPLPQQHNAHSDAPHRTLIETLSEPQTLRVLLYTGAAMFVVGIVIWLRDVLYLKLQEPSVQAALLALGTLAITASGWYTILRTRQRLTGRALTLTGSLLVPVNFWFLVRSGLIANNGRAWVVCAFCALLYAQTAAFLREKLYVYLAGLATIATAWAFIFRVERQAAGLYALALMLASVIFVHLARMFMRREEKRAEGDEREDSDERDARTIGRWSYELWGVPLARMALACALLCGLMYMPFRLGSAPSLYDGIFRFFASDYDSSIAMLLFAGIAYVVWFTGRYLYTDRRVAFYTLSALALFWTEFLAFDGLRLSGAVHLVLFTLSVLLIAIVVRFVRDAALSKALYVASLLVSVLLAPVAFSVIATPLDFVLLHSFDVLGLAAAYAVLSFAPSRHDSASSTAGDATLLRDGTVTQAALAYAAAICASIAFVIALIVIIVPLQSATTFVAACAVWPFILYAGVLLVRTRERARHLAAPMLHTAEAGYALLLLWACVTAVLLYLLPDAEYIRWRPSMFCVLSGAIAFGVLLLWRERSRYGAGLASIATLVFVAAGLNALQDYGVWPVAWPVALGVIAVAFFIERASEHWRESVSAADATNLRWLQSITPETIIKLVMDCAVLACAVLWFAPALILTESGSWSAALVLLLALLYWSERTIRKRHASLAYLAVTHAGAFIFALLVALRVRTDWFALIFMLTLFPAFFLLSRAALQRQASWLARPMNQAASVTLALVSFAAFCQVALHLDVGDPQLLAPCVTMAAVAVLSFAASFFSNASIRVWYFRVGLCALIVAFAFGALRAGYDPVEDVEIYTTPVAVLLIVIAYLAVRREWNEYAQDVSLLFWTGSILLCGPLLIRALQFRLLLDLPAPWRDLAVLCASLALIIFGVIGRLRAPVIIGGTTLLLELLTLTLTSVDWLQVPLKFYLITVGALMLIVFWLFEYRREQILLVRQRLDERRTSAREQFGEWR
jgi:hypothetical protein